MWGRGRVAGAAAVAAVVEEEENSCDVIRDVEPSGTVPLPFPLRVLREKTDFKVCQAREGREDIIEDFFMLSPR